MLRRLLPALFLPLALILTGAASPSPAAASSMPTKEQWISLVYRDLTGAVAYVRGRAAEGGKLALNLDIDNTSLASYYAPGQAVNPVLRIAQDARNRGVYIFFNTGRDVDGRSSTIAQLQNAGFPINSLCMRYHGERVVHSKQRCRAAWTSRGYTIIANIGNHATDFEGGDYDRKYALPNFNYRLG